MEAGIDAAVDHPPRMAAAGDPDRAGIARPGIGAGDIPGAELAELACGFAGEPVTAAAFKLTIPIPAERGVHENCAKVLDALLLPPALCQ